MPPASLREEGDPVEPGVFVVAEGMSDWLAETILCEGHRLYNRDHAHLEYAFVGYLWTNAPNTKGMMTVIGTAERMPPMGFGAWPRARAMAQLRDWFGRVPDFLVTLSAPWWFEADNASRLALVEHCSCLKDEDGEPILSERTGRPKFLIRDHDVSQFIGVVRRYGMDAGHVRDLVEVAQRGPTIGPATIIGACGACK
jgi:hypothetical protein